MPTTAPPHADLIRRAQAIAKALAETHGSTDKLLAKRADLFAKMKSVGFTNADIASAAGVSEGMVRKVTKGRT